MKKNFLILILLGIFLLGLVYASYNFDSHSIRKEYGPGDVIVGWVKMDFSDESGGGLFSDSYENEISLSDLMVANARGGFCEPQGCALTYSASNAATEKTFSLNAGESKIIGLKLTGDIESISSFTFNVSSDAEASCANQIEIDFLNDKEIDIVNTKSSEELCGAKSYGCFSQSKPTSEFTIGNTPYCQRIRLNKAPGFDVGAYVNPKSGDHSLKMFVDDGDFAIVPICDLSEITSAAEFSCSVDLSVTEKQDYYVCLKSDTGQGYTTLGYIDSAGCGFQGNPVMEEVAAYRIFAQPKGYDAVGEMDLPESSELIELTKDYLVEKYGGDMNCGSGGCVVPIKFTAKTNQEITVEDLDLSYSIVGGSLQEHDFYDVEETAAIVNSDSIKFYLDKANLSVSDDFGDETYKLDFKGDELFSETISIKEVASISGLSPTTTMAGYPTEFKVSVNLYGKNITSYDWEFGNETSITTTTNKVVHGFDAIGVYDLTITITDSAARKSSRTFSINVTSPKDAIEGLINKKLEDLTNVKTEIASFSLFYQNSLNSVLDLESADASISSIQILYDVAETDDDYIAIMTALFDLDIPESIFVSKSADLFLVYPDESFVDLDFLTEVGRGDYDTNEDDYIDAILLWNQDNLETQANFKEISAQYETGSEMILSFFELDISLQEDLDYSFFVVVEKLEAMTFDYVEFEEKLGYLYTSLTDSKKLVFATTEEVVFTSLPVFISPEIVRLSLGDATGAEVTKVSKWLYFILIVLVLLIIGFGLYLYLQIWYKKKYESHLFPNRNDLYNLISYVQGEKKKGLTDDQIKIKLGKSGWSGEKINYVVKKYAGKRTGMVELGFGKGDKKQMRKKRF